MDPMNSIRDPLERHNPTFENAKRSSQKKKKKKGETLTQVLFSTIQMDTRILSFLKTPINTTLHLFKASGFFLF